MFFDLSPLELVVLLGLSVVLFGPDKLPAAAMSAARLLRQVRAMAESSKAQVREQLGPEFADLGLDQLDPRRFVREQFAEEAGQLRGAFDDLGRDPRPEAPAEHAEPSSQYVDAT